MHIGAAVSLSETKGFLQRMTEKLPGIATQRLNQMNELRIKNRGSPGAMLHSGSLRRTAYPKHCRKQLPWERLEELQQRFQTIAGNLATASPISDLNPIWMACGAEVVLCSQRCGRRTVLIDQAFFPGYRKTTIAPDEVIAEIIVPLSRTNQLFRVYKQVAVIYAMYEVNEYI